MSGAIATRPRRVAQVVPAVAAADVPGLMLTRMIATPHLDHLDPFLLLSDFWPAALGQPVGGFGDHPHRGFETVTYMIAGEMRHRDHTGAEGVIGPGAVQWMTAGRGIIHAETPVADAGGNVRGFQLWVNLPAAEKMRPPAYQEYTADQVPEISPAPGVIARVIAGRFGETAGPVTGIPVAPLYLDLAFSAEATLDVALPGNHNAVLYVIDGVLDVAGIQIDAHHLAVLSDGEDVEMRAPGSARALLIAAAPIGEPVARYGPFVMNTEDEIRQAFVDYRERRF